MVLTEGTPKDSEKDLTQCRVRVCARGCTYRVPGLGSCISGTFVFTVTTQVLRTHTRASEALCLQVKNSHPRASINSELLTCHINFTNGSEFRIFILRCGRPKSGMSTYGVRSTSIAACQHNVGDTGRPPCQYMVLGVQHIGMFKYGFGSTSIPASYMVLGVPALQHVNTMYGSGSTSIQHVNILCWEYQHTGMLIQHMVMGVPAYRMSIYCAGSTSILAC